MKKYMLSMMMLISLSTFANPTEGKKTEKVTSVATATAAEINPMMTVKQLQAENALLKQQLFTLMNDNEELKSKLSFDLLMNNMFSNLNAQKQIDQVENLNATVNYNKMMSAMLHQINSRK